MHRKKYSHRLLLPFALLSFITAAGKAELSGNIEAQARYFFDNPSWPQQESQHLQYSLNTTLEHRWRNKTDSQRTNIQGFFRWDKADDQRNLVDFREAYWAYQAGNTDWLVGINTVFWGVTESLHLVDIINQTDTTADIDGEQKLGQPMINLSWQHDWGLLEAFLLPYFRERRFPGTEGRLRFPAVIDDKNAQYEASNKDKHTDIALRYSHYFGDFDIGMSYFRGTNREPRLIINTLTATLQQTYDQIEQLGLDLQYTYDAWLLKLEAIARKGFRDNFIATVVGFEFTHYQLLGLPMDLGYLLEYQYDDRGEEESFTIGNNDLFFGARLAFNDAQDSAILAGFVWDHQSDEIFLNIEAERRFGENFIINSKLRIFSNANQEDIFYAFRKDDYLEISAARYF